MHYHPYFIDEDSEYPTYPKQQNDSVPILGLKPKYPSCLPRFSPAPHAAKGTAWSSLTQWPTPHQIGKVSTMQNLFNRAIYLLFLVEKLYPSGSYVSEIGQVSCKGVQTLSGHWGKRDHLSKWMILAYWNWDRGIVMEKSTFYFLGSWPLKMWVEEEASVSQVIGPSLSTTLNISPCLAHSFPVLPLRLSIQALIISCLDHGSILSPVLIQVCMKPISYISWNSPLNLWAC